MASARPQSVTVISFAARPVSRFPQMTFLGTPDFVHGSRPRVGVLLVNLGTPADPSPRSVRKYLAEFLSDPRVIEAPRLLWWLVLHGVILRTRPRRSAHAYQKIWTPEGSPLLVESRQLAAGLAEWLRQRFGDDVIVDLAMTYGQPSIPSVLERFREQNVQRLLVLPLYPQYSSTTTGSIFEFVTRELARLDREAFERVYATRRVRDAYAPSPAQTGARRLANLCLG